MVEKEPPDPAQTEENLFETAPAFQRPIFWLVLLMVPILFAFGSAILSGGNEAPAPAAPAVTAPNKVPEETNYRRGKTQSAAVIHDREEEDTPPAASPLVTDCMFDMLRGRPMTAPLYEQIKRLGRPVFLYEEAGQAAPSRDPLRINIYLNPQKTITRIACG